MRRPHLLERGTRSAPSGEGTGRIGRSRARCGRVGRGDTSARRGGMRRGLREASRRSSHRLRCVRAATRRLRRAAGRGERGGLFAGRRGHPPGRHDAGASCAHRTRCVVAGRRHAGRPPPREDARPPVAGQALRRTDLPASQPADLHPHHHGPRAAPASTRFPDDGRAGGGTVGGMVAVGRTSAGRSPPDPGGLRPRRDRRRDGPPPGSFVGTRGVARRPVRPDGGRGHGSRPVAVVLGRPQPAVPPGDHPHGDDRVGRSGARREAAADQPAGVRAR